MKFISHTKFPKKVLLWLTIREKVMSKLLFFHSELAVNEKVYSRKCLPEVASFIKKYHKGEDAVLESIVEGDGAAEYRCGTEVDESAQCPPAASHREFLSKLEAQDLFQQFCPENGRGI